MSAEAVYWARDEMRHVHDGPYLLLFTLAWMHKNGSISEPLHEIAAAAHMSVSSVKRHLETLTDIGALTYVPARGRGQLGAITLMIEKASTVDRVEKAFNGGRDKKAFNPVENRSSLDSLVEKRRSERRPTRRPTLNPLLNNLNNLKEGTTTTTDNGVFIDKENRPPLDALSWMPSDTEWADALRFEGLDEAALMAVTRDFLALRSTPKGSEYPVNDEEWRRHIRRWKLSHADYKPSPSGVAISANGHDKTPVEAMIAEFQSIWNQEQEEEKASPTVAAVVAHLGGWDTVTDFPSQATLTAAFNAVREDTP